MDINVMIDEFIKLYGGTKDDLRVFQSPGRVNLIGEHTDYNGGYVFPAALTMKTTIVARKRNDNIIRLKATDLDVVVEADINNLDAYRDLSWGNYQIGVAYVLKQAGYDIVGCDLLYDDTVPHGSGLSSSAAIEVSTGICFATFSNEKNGIDKKIDMIEMALLGQKAENQYCGVNCGIMDQFASAMGKKDHAIFLKCDDLTYDYAPIKLDGMKIILSNTKKKHSLGASKYNERRSECEKGFEMLKTVLPDKSCLGEISVAEFEENKHIITDEVILKRIKHVIYEDDRVLNSLKALKNGDIELFGRYMNESGDSLRYDYEVTGDELDVMVEEGRKIAGVLGSRMTGGGFGGCTVSIVKSEFVDTFINEVGKNYKARTGITPEFYVSEIGDGGKEIKTF